MLITGLLTPLLITTSIIGLAAISQFYGKFVSSRRLRASISRIGLSTEHRAWSTMPFPELMQQQKGQLNGFDPQLFIDLQCLAHRLGCQLKVTPSGAKRRGALYSTGGMFFTSRGKSFIALAGGLSQDMQMAILAHEIGHALLHGTSQLPIAKNRAEREADMFAAAMMRAYGQPIGRQSAYMQRAATDAGSGWYADSALKVMPAVRVALGYMDTLNPRR
jgi:hypothetical protein